MSSAIDLKYHYKLNYRKNYNIVAEAYKVIYFNTQKNANSTMKAQFIEVLNLPKTEEFPKDVHINYDFPTALKEDIISKYQDFLKILIVRNPWERLVSCYTNKIKQPTSRGKNYILQCSPDLSIGMSFEEFVEVVCKIPDSEADYHFCSQSYLMLYPDGYFPINYICNMEKLSTHIAEIKAMTGIPFSELSNLNRSKSTSYEHFYTPELIEKIRQRYQIDIELFKYEFGKENEAFSFGNVAEDWKETFANHSFMLSILREKNSELTKAIAHKNAPLIRKINQLTKDVENAKKAHEAIKNSSSWKITAPLRRLAK